MEKLLNDDREQNKLSSYDKIKISQKMWSALLKIIQRQLYQYQVFTSTTKLNETDLELIFARINTIIESQYS